MNANPRSSVYLAVALIALTGCASSRTVFTVNVNSFSAEYGVPPSSHVYVYVDSEDTDLMKWEFKRKLEYLLGRHGYHTTEIANADFILFFAYGIGSDTETYTRYVYDPTTQVSPGPTGSTGPAGGRALAAVAQGIAASTQKMRPQQAQRTVHHRILRLVALDAKALRTDDKRVAWQGDIRSTGSSADLRLVLNYMAAAAVEMFGKDTGSSMTFRVDLEDPVVVEMLARFK